MLIIAEDQTERQAPQKILIKLNLTQLPPTDGNPSVLLLQHFFPLYVAFVLIYQAVILSQYPTTYLEVQQVSKRRQTC